MKNCQQKSCVKSRFKGSGLKRREDELEGDLNFFGIYKHEKRHGLWKRHIFKIGVDPRTQGKHLKQLSLIGIPLTLENMKIFMILLKGFIVFFYFNQYAAILHNFLYPARISKFFHQQPTFLVKQKMISFSHMNIVYPTMIFFISSIEGFFQRVRNLT